MIKHPHDSAFKAGMKDKRVAEDMLRHYLPEDLRNKLNFKTLKHVDKSYIEKELLNTHSDVLFDIEMNNAQGFIYLLCEHQSTYDKRMPLRLWRYTLNIIEDYLKKQHEKYPLVVPMLVYNGEVSPYPGGAAYSSYFEDPDLARRHMFQGFQLVDLSVIPDEDIMKQRWASVMQLLLKHYRSERLLEKILQLSKEGVIQFQLRSDGLPYLENMIYYVLNSPKLKNKELAVKAMSQESDELGEMGMSLLQMEREEGRQEGRQGVALKMLASGFDDSIICEVTGISPTDLAELKPTLH